MAFDKIVYICKVENNDISGFINDSGPVASITLSESGNTVVRRIRRGGRWYVAKSPGREIDSVLGRELIRKEYELLSRLSHRNIVRVHSCEEIPGYGTTIIMDWIDGTPLDRYLASGKASRNDRRRLSRQLIDVLAYIHDNNITHRDLKPSNLLVDNLGNIVVIDFGLGDDPASCMFKNVSGTPGFSAPELTVDGVTSDWRRADVYALGIVLRAIDGGFIYRHISRRCTRRNPAQRPDGAPAVKAAYSRMRFRLRTMSGAIAFIIVVISAIGLISLRNTAPMSTAPATETTDTAITDSIPRPTEMDTPAEDIATRESAVHGDIQEGKTEGNVPAPAPAPDVNFALLRAMEQRDSLRHLARTSGHTDYERGRIDTLTDSLLEIGRTAGWTADEYDFARKALKSQEFYEGRSIPFYIATAYLPADTLSTVTP